MFRDISAFHDWFADRSRANAYRVARTPLDQLDGWHFDAETNLVHRSGRFYSIEGLEVVTDHREVESWTQPIIRQPEIGILGILVKEFDGVPHCLMQAKMEPGNINMIQLSPTVQATRSNYMRVHQGNAVPYLEYFVAPRRGRVVFDALQSEQGSWFLNKRNRNMIVEVADEVELLEDFRWLTFDQLGELLREDNLVNMDSRTVLSGLPFLSWPGGSPGLDGRAAHPAEELLSWFTEARSRYRLDRRVLPLAQVGGWVRDAEVIRHESNRYFTVVGVDVQASNREVSSWSQPMIKPSDRGVIAFLSRWIDGVFHVLVQARTEAGTSDVVEMSPTVNCIPSNYRGSPVAQRPRYLDQVLMAPASSVLLDVVHSEEGGRFYHAENRYLVVETDEAFPPEVPEDFVWMTPEQLVGFVRYGNYVNVAARCLLTCMNVGHRVPEPV
ncbi:NDP-hexose 2,3-dehydratase family protein [Saccharopolyspora sp. WRP15-2]|uniref:NDP-hexose 2,3-dehydratase family protein n=1 Tax=Saccharopolyspora oryzae TaxID=2997343 RepID=A0ABT4USN8_9PSEU|nr:NDP-hexose 2,3-dehydratase family protein [Saccharopolyspora oryzae]MDA3624717.1 NDP-hexose 2,3-dehydratase family protein [Saccharopolyspora oryzae]